MEMTVSFHILCAQSQFYVGLGSTVLAVGMGVAGLAATGYAIKYLTSGTVPLLPSSNPDVIAIRRQCVSHFQDAEKCAKGKS